MVAFDQLKGLALTESSSRIRQSRHAQGSRPGPLVDENVYCSKVALLTSA